MLHDYQVVSAVICILLAVALVWTALTHNDQ